MNLKIGRINVQSMFTCFNDLKKVLESSGLDVIALSVTWHSHKQSSSAFNILNYSLIRKDPLRRSGVVAIYVSTQYNPELIDTTVDKSSIEQSWIKVKIVDYWLSCILSALKNNL